MPTTRRSVLLAAGALAAAPRLAFGDPAPADPRLAERADGQANARTTAVEWFSFTCPHCAHFAADVYPSVKAQLVDVGRLRFVFREYPRDQVDLMAAMVARSLPPERYDAFKDTLLASQARWAFDRSVEPKDELAKMAALAGMPREMFDRVVADEALKAAILGAQAEAEKQYSIDSTPTFIIDGRAHTGEAGVTYEAFAKLIPA